METGREKHEKPELLPHLEPPGEPVREPRVLGAPIQLDVGCDHPREVAHGQHLDRVHRQSLVQCVHGEVVPTVPVPTPVAPFERPTDLVPAKLEREFGEK